jgi:hypothetical protein
MLIVADEMALGSAESAVFPVPLRPKRSDDAPAFVRRGRAVHREQACFGAK